MAEADDIINILKQRKDESDNPGFNHVWYLKSNTNERRWQRCRILAVGASGSTVVEFLSDGEVIIAPRGATRKFENLTFNQKRKVLHGRKEPESLDKRLL